MDWALILGAIRKGRMRVLVTYCGSGSDRDCGSGIVQSVRGDECVINDLNGGAFYFPVSEVKSIRLDPDQPVLILIENWQAGEGVEYA